VYEDLTVFDDTLIVITITAVITRNMAVFRQFSCNKARVTSAENIKANCPDRPLFVKMRYINKSEKDK